MAGMFGSAIVGELVNRTASFLVGNYEMQAGVKDKLERLEELLIKIQSAVEAAEGRQIKNTWLLRWLRRLKDAAYQADDVLDTFEYQILEQKANGDEVSSSLAASSTNVAKRMRTAARSLFSCDEDVKELSSVVENLERIAAGVGDFVQLLQLDDSSKKSELPTNSRITSSLLPEEPIGREEEKERIINLVLQSESNAVGNVSVIPILGIGGVGKTTLAQLVCKDERVKQHFSPIPIMWVCVSDSFDVVRLTREILEQADSNFKPGDIENFNSLQVNLEEKLRSKKFLLVLDDVWSENERNVWEKLRTPLLHGKEGSKIIVTSRLPRVAKLMGTMDPIRLDGLPEDVYLPFFKKCAFGVADPDEDPRLAATGTEIAKRLKGSPLAAKTLGALLKDNLNEEYWQSILKSDIWELKQGQDGIIPVLRLSYQHLPAHLQSCFAYCSIFPKDWEFKRDDLIYMWMAEGFIHSNTQRERIEDIGSDYFDDLISKAFFEPAWSEDSASKDIYKIHDLLHDLAESVSNEICCRIESDEPMKIPDSVRHLSVMTTNLAGLTEHSSVLKHLRTLNFLFKSKSNLNVADLREVLEKLKSIRVLNLVNCHMEELPISTCNLMHVRYLNLSNTGIKVLPDQLCRFYHLEILILSGLKPDGAPASLGKLINLRHLIQDQECWWSDYTIPIISKISGVSKLTRLDELESFHVGKAPGFEIGQLKDLSNLRGSLQIMNLENVGSKEEAMEARLSCKRNVVTLELAWCDAQRSARCEVTEEVLEGLQPHPHLKGLRIIGYSGVRSPSWLIEKHYLKNLVNLKLHGCQNWKELPPLGQLSSLKFLQLSGMHAIEEVGCGFYGSGVVKGFPSLGYLSFVNFPELKEWCAIEDDQLFPRLNTLEIKDCSKLRALPSLPPTLVFLTLVRVGITLLPAFHNPKCPLSAFPSSSSSSSPPSSSSLFHLTILNCPNLENFDEWSKEEGEKLSKLSHLHTSYPNIYLLRPSLDSVWIEDSDIEDVNLSMCLQRSLSLLRSIMIRRCPHITTLPSADLLRHLTKLKVLTISDCGELRSIGGLRALISLDQLEVFRCPKLTSLAADQIERAVQEEVAFSSVFNIGRLEIDNPLLLKVLSREGPTSLGHLGVKCANEITISTTEMEEAFQHLTSLSALSFKDCNSLRCLPACLKYLPLEYLWIKNCPNFQSLLGKEALPSSQKYLYIKNCHPALKERYREGGPDRQTIDHISYISIND
ncbi:disease resistance protein RGA2-like [Typha angustifolia]|uniref:disease resistance protein RGA2-like n=1 Tax=Typha angustifolia TaxID=59011 RepID=UPI003C307027